ncbi:uncharacterized protein EAF01_005323 [Botrytis porri]|uniref:Uncharacterized protein n=1 Tax=Botrytis porri TaxID=87229 RepID=A0A4Z1L3L3_9HELO|nr:uncharacterized protein EAF01_005323 [Botrytis porri]KAF7907737.1 hypothetical protein EAF01_005323 [Botrytis porri]TGO91371.1 hypothetical protein BPOR_0030g00310 [Botrytis porri]
MLSNYLLIAMIATSISALPLNINLGAYSPALVVGDGEISFGGKADVSNLMNALEGAAVGGATANNGAAANGGAAAATTPTQAQAAPAAPAAPAAVQGGTEGKTEAQVTALQGMGKEIAPRVVKLERSDVDRAAKRDIQTLTAALNYAAGAIKTSPEVQLGTEDAGVGILIKAGGTGNTAAAAGTAAKTKMGKREDGVADPKIKTTVTTMFIRGGPSVGQTNSISTVRNVEDINGSAVTKREPSPGIDGVNLNMIEGSVAELTFVETRSADDEE